MLISIQDVAKTLLQGSGDTLQPRYVSNNNGYVHLGSWVNFLERKFAIIWQRREQKSNTG